MNTESKRPSLSYKGMRKLYLGDFNASTTHVLSDELRRITFADKQSKVLFTMLVKNLYELDEEVLEYEELNLSIPDHISERMKEAQEHKEK